MAYIIIYITVYLMLGLFFWSLCAINKKSIDNIAGKFKRTADGQNVTDNWYANTRCQTYTIQSLYSQDFIVPEISHIHYAFRTPLPSFKVDCGIATVCQEFVSQSSCTGQVDTIRHGNITCKHEKPQILSPRLKRLCANGESI